MISIRTNLTNYIAQQNMATSTNKLNTAIERLSTGYKINHASDNAANYSISQNLNTQLSACDIAADNIAMGMDLLQTAQDTIAGMQTRGSRLHALITQARNGTYGASSLAALNSEAEALVSEINRLYINTEYNGMKLLEIPLPDWAQTVKENAGTGAGLSGACGLSSDISPTHNGFIASVDEDTPEVIITDPSQLANAIATKTVIGIGNARTLEELAKLVNGTSTYAAGQKTCSGKTIVLTENVDISDICAENTDGSGNGGWTPIGTDSSYYFAGTFNGNGHKVTGLYIKRTDTNYQGLFGYATKEIKNIGVENINVTGASNTGGLVGYIYGKITNSYVTGNIKGSGSNTGALSGLVKNVLNSYAIGNVNNAGYRTGGLVGQSYDSVTNCFTRVNVTGTGNSTGGVAGSVGSNISNSYAAGNVTGENYTGGLAGSISGTITNCYATGAVTGSGYSTGGLGGYVSGIITNSYATGNVKGNGNNTGGLAAEAISGVSNSYATGNITNEGRNTGGLVGYSGADITNSYATGNIVGLNCVGGLVGHTDCSITNSYAIGCISGSGYVGGLAGDTYQNTAIVSNCYAQGNVSSTEGHAGGLVGFAHGRIENSYAIGNIQSKATCTGGLAGNADGGVINSYATGNVTGKEKGTGGLVGATNSYIENSFATGSVSGETWVGGLVGVHYKPSGTITNNQIFAGGKVSGTSKVGSLVGGMYNTDDGTSFSTITITNAFARSGIDMIGFEGTYSGAAYTSGQMEGWLENIEGMNLNTNMQIGINSGSDSRIIVDTKLNINLSLYDLTSDSAYNSVTNFLNQLSQKSTELGAAQNRLESALESTMVQMDNLTSSLSTIRDADIGKISSEYIRQQILQQACATLMSTANQTPAIALQLL